VETGEKGRQALEFKLQIYGFFHNLGWLAGGDLLSKSRDL